MRLASKSKLVNAKNPEWVVPSGPGDPRLDRVLALLADFSRKKAKALLDQGRVFVNGRKVFIASWVMRPGDRIEIRSEKEVLITPAEKHFLKIVHEDAHILVVEKDAGVPCEASPVATKPTLVSILNAYFKRKEPHLKHHYLGLVHRLDRDTSGLMVYSKTKDANRIADQFKRHTIGRKYMAVVEGRMDDTRGTIEGFLKKNTLLKGGRKVATSTAESGQHAVTHYRVFERYEKATLAEITLNTGRTHQIRVHLSSIGHPVVGDTIYRGKAAPAVPFGRQALHASYLKFHHPVTGEPMEFRSELPRDMRRLVDKLRFSS